MQQRHKPFSRFADLFEQRAHRPLPPLEADLDYTQLPASLARSLAVFQLGESGGGTVVEQARQSSLPAVDTDYVRALDRFVREEHRHANLLAVCVRLMGGKLISRNWTARLFVVGRRLMGLRLKILVLLAAEVVGLTFYRFTASRLPPCRMRDVLFEIIGDEHDHLQFHSAFLAQQVQRRSARLLFVAAWRLLMACAGFAVILDHRRTLKDLYIDVGSFRDFLRSYRREVEWRVLGRLAAPEPRSERLTPGATTSHAEVSRTT